MTLWMRIALWAALAAALLSGLHWWISSIEARGYERGRAEVRAEWTAADLARTRATLRQSEISREEEARREAEKEKVIHEAHEDLRRARAAAADAARAADGLRDQLATFVADARSRAAAPNPGPSTGSPPAADPVVVLADLFASADARAGDLAEEADRRRVAGTACERSSDALTRPAGASP